MKFSINFFLGMAILFPSFSLLAQPAINNESAAAIIDISATLNADLDLDGASLESKGFLFSDDGSDDFTLGSGEVDELIDGSPSVTEITFDQINLDPNTTYYYRPFVEYDGGTVAYGDLSNFTTLEELTVESIVRENPSDANTNQTALVFRVTFSRATTLPTVSDFSIDASGLTTSISGISGANGDSEFDVTVEISAGDNGNVRLDVLEEEDVQGWDAGADGVPLRTAFTTGEVFNFNSIQPSLSSITLPADGTYNAGDNLAFSLVFSEDLIYDGSGGDDAQLRLLFDTESSSPILANFTGHTGNTLNFTYTVQTGDRDLSGFEIDALVLNDASISDLFGNEIDGVAGGELEIESADYGSTEDILVEALETGISNISVPGAWPAAGEDITLSIGSEIRWTVVFDESYTLDGSFADFRIEIEIDGETKNMVHTNNTSNSITFLYTIVEGNGDNDQVVFPSSITALNGAQLLNAGGSPIDLNFPAGFLGTLPNVFVDAVRPTITASSFPPGGTYSLGTTPNYIEVTLNFSKNVSLGNPSTNLPFVRLTNFSGTPTTRQASYFSGNGSNQWVFRYTLAENDNTSGGSIGFTNQVQLNGNTIRDEFGNNLIRDIPNIPSPSNIVIDAIRPVPDDLVRPADGVYGIGDVLNFQVRYTKDLQVGGTPRIVINMGGQNKNFNYAELINNNRLRFSYTIQEGDFDDNGISFSNNNIQTPGGAFIRDMVQNPAILNLSTLIAGINLSEVKVDAVRPEIVGITPNFPSNPVGIGEQLNFIVEFSEPVLASGTPALILELESGAEVNANLTSVPTIPTTELTFRYTVQEGVTSEGISVVGFFQNGSNRVFDEIGNLLNPSFLSTPVDFPAVVIDAVRPVVSSVTFPTPPSTGYWVHQVHNPSTQSNEINLTVNFSKNVFVGGSQNLNVQINIDGTNRTMAYQSGSGTNALVFRYVVQNGDKDLDGATFGNQILGDGTLRDAAGNNALRNLNIVTQPDNVLIDGIRPFITDISYIGLDNIQDNDTTVTTPAPITIRVEFQEEVVVASANPRLQLDFEGVIKNAPKLSGTAGQPEPNVLVFRYTVQNNDIDLNGITVPNTIDLNGATIRDLASNNLVNTLPNLNTPIVRVDAIRPVVTSIDPPAAGTYVIGDVLSFDVNYDKDIFVTGTPRLRVNIGSAQVFANYVAGTGGPTLTFEYTIQAGLSDNDGVSLEPTIGLNGGLLRDYVPNNANLTLNNPGGLQFNDVLVDAIEPIVTELQAPSNGFYKENDQLNFRAVFNKNLNINTGGGSPYLEVTIGTDVVQANYVSLESPNTLLFRYTVQDGDLDLDGIEIANEIFASGAIIEDLVGNEAVLEIFTLPNTGGVLVDAVPPFSESITLPADGFYTAGQQLNFTVGFSEPVFVTTATGVPFVQIILSDEQSVNAAYQSGSGSANLVFRYTVQNGDLSDGPIEVADVITFNGGNIRDAATNPAFPEISGIPAENGVFVDAVPPSGYTVSFIEDVVNLENQDAISFQMLNAEIGATYNFTIESNGGGDPITGSGTVTDSDEILGPFDFTDLGEGTISLAFTLTDPAGNQGDQASTSIPKNIDIPILTIVNVFSNNDFEDSVARVGNRMNIEFVSNVILREDVQVNIAGQPANVNTGSAPNYFAFLILGDNITEGEVPFTITFSSEAGNPGTPVTGTTNGSKVIFDKTRPTLQIGTAFTPPATEDPFRLDLQFSEAVRPLSSGNFNVDNGTVDRVEMISPGLAHLFIIPAEEGIVRVTVNNTQIRDVAGNLLEPVAPFDIQFAQPFAEFLEQPADLELCNGEDAEFRVRVTGIGTTYQWQVDEGGGFINADPSLYDGVNDADFFIRDVDITQDEFRIRVIIDGVSFTGLISEVAVLSVKASPVIQDQPASNLQACSDSDLILEVQASGTDLAYEWFKDGNSLDVTTARLTLVEPSASAAGVYFCRISNDCATIDSELYEVSVFSAPGEVQAELLGNEISLNVNPSFIQWFRDGQAINGSNGSVLVVPGPGVYQAEAGDDPSCTRLSNEIEFFVSSFSDLEKGIKIYPNPARDRVFFGMPAGKSFSALKIYDANGRLIQEIDPWSLQREGYLSVEHLSHGMYIIDMTIDDHTLRKRLLIE